ncbi:hypothetical protein PRN20_20190 [Devosia sp. ZB163]|uniref:hypothetical protein n=1 Tax=Devosia sp. ZB163 TaxID=3025938 RepID=UPI00236126A8|nr:hypothetical protein [Devosia sp. ZB163]MDC9826062.1 hypothetical protein [Devosia sp. ZB163]
MARAAEQFRPADVTAWGIVALVVWAVAILGANLSGIIPPSVYGALHASRLEGSTLNQLRSQVATLEADATRLKQENLQLAQRFTMNEEAAGAVTKRVGALEVSLPRLIEQAQARRPAAVVDTMSTGSIGAGKTLTFETDGGTVAVQQRPIDPATGEVKLAVMPLAATMPAAIPTATPAPGIALGVPVTADAAEAQWQEMLSEVGTMLVGLSPVLGQSPDSSAKLLIAGPLVDRATAIELCSRLGKAGVSCEPTEYRGDPLPLLN